MDTHDPHGMIVGGARPPDDDPQQGLPPGSPVGGSAWRTGECGWCVVRGSPWDGFPDDVRSTSRFGIDSGKRNISLGFRVVRELE